MARSRNLKPSFFTNDKLADIPPIGRLLFQGLWCIADRDGRLEDRPKRIKAELLPYDDCCVEDLLLALVEHEFIIRYSANGNQFIQVVNFTKHQNPHVKEAPSTIPAPCLSGASTVPAQEIPAPAGLIPSSLLPIKPIVRLVPHSSAQFDEFWHVWPSGPRKVGKAECLKRWMARGLNAEAGKIIEHVLAMKSTRQWIDFCPAPLTYINQRRWEDGEPEDAAGAQSWD